MTTSDYWHSNYICPFWQSAGKKTIRCEGDCVIVFPERAETADYIGRYCASFDYPQCSIAGAKIRHYEKTE